MNGVTRSNVIDLSKENDLTIFEKDFLLDDVHSANEVFVTGTFAGILPVISVDGHVIGEGIRGVLTEKLQKWYALDLEKQCKQ